MSRSPTLKETKSGAGTHAEMTAHHTRLMRLLRSGRSLSGHERHCAFLNTGDGQFATISTLSGFDFPDDGRALGLVDWDFDGDIDAWTASRNAPQVRLLSNQNAKGNFLMLRLRGKESNTDGIGARIAVQLNNGRVIIQEAHAGEGYLSQRSRWLHFGLGAAKPNGFSVHWPGGKTEKYSWSKPNHWLIVEENVAAPQLWTPPSVPPLPASPPLHSDTTSHHVAITYPVPLPRLYRKSESGPKPSKISLSTKKPTLVLLWTDGCDTCKAELRHFTSSQSQLQGIDILALHADDTDPDSPTVKGAPETFLRSIRFPHSAARATDETLTRLQYLNDILFARETDLSFPRSYLISPQNQVAAIYRGPADVKQLLRDVKSLGIQGPDRQGRLLPYPGRWQNRPKGVTPVGIPADLARRGAFTDTHDYVKKIRTDLRRQSLFAPVAEWLGDESVKRQEWTDAIGYYQDVITLEPKNLTVLNNLAYYLATARDKSVRNPDQAVKLAENAAALTKRQNPQVLDTLATAYVAAKQPTRAQTVLQEALPLAKRLGQKKLAEEIAKKIR